MENEEKNLMDEFKEAVTNELNSNEEIKTDESETQGTAFKSKIEVNNEGLDTNVDEVLNNIDNKEENNTEDVITSNYEDADNINHSQNNMKPNKKKSSNKSIIVLLVLLILIILGMGGYFVYDKYIKNNNKKDNNTTTTTTTTVKQNSEINDEEIRKQQQEEISKTLTMEDNSNKVLYIYETPLTVEETLIQKDWYKLLGEYNCKNDNCKGSLVETGLASITDGEYTFLYDANEKKILFSLNNENNNNLVIKKAYRSNGNIDGLSIMNETNKIAYFDLKMNKRITDFEYEVFVRRESGKLVASYGNGCTDGLNYYVCGSNEISTKQIIDIYDIKTGILLYHDETALDNIRNSGISVLDISNGTQTYNLILKNNKLDVYDVEFNAIITGNDVVYNGFDYQISYPKVLDNGNILINNGTSYSIYNSKGEIVFKSKEYKEIKFIYNYDPVDVVANDGKIKILDINENVISEFDDMPDNLSIMRVEYIPADSHIEADCGGTKSGIYIYAGSGISSNIYMYYYNFDTKEKDFEVKNWCLTV